MKKIRLAIIIIYATLVSLITILTIVFIARAFQRGTDIYFQEPTKSELRIPSQSEIEKTIEILKKFRII